MIVDVISAFYRRTVDRRKHKRAQARFPVEFLDLTGVVQLSIDHIRDISEGGMRFRAPKRVCENDFLDMVINIRSLQRKIPVRAKVVWTRSSESSQGFVTGVSFTSILGDDRRILREYINRQFT